MPTQIPFQQLLEALLDSEKPIHPRYLYRLSDLDQSEVDALAAIWPQFPLWRRQALMEDVEELSESDTLLSFEALARLAIQDEDAKVRLAAVSTLWDYEDRNLVPIFLDRLKNDHDTEVRAAAAGALGQYVYAGEVDEIPIQLLKTIEEALLCVMNSGDVPEVRRASLESLGYSSREEVIPHIKAAYSSRDKEWIASALFAMGRSANNAWQPQVMAMLESNLPILRCEAARAAGELEIEAALPLLMELLGDTNDDTRLASIWALSQIGGEGVQEALEQMYEEAEDDQEIEALDLALDNLAFTQGAQLIPLFDIPEDEGDDFDDESLDLLDDEELLD
jgi:HEAT repeat protein